MRKIILFLLSVILIISCSQQQNKPIKIKIKHLLKKKRKKILNNKITKKAKSFKKFSYNREEVLRDPFKPFIKITEKVKKPLIPVLPENIIPTPLTEYSINQYRLVGIITDSKPPLAMVETADKKGLIFSTGDYIGSEYYKVIKILNDTVILEKKYLTLDKKEKIENKILKIDIME